ncbi:chitobiase/beta-hexosaminidase C-terminal domain-containing protein, partial [Candidatus Bipolaricaulota bacterium]|nr:chitobiase/beta-hexosaminidase C-terminal domain-containing protein [Candidatus Bipolaricaulota bacterium]
ITIDPLQPVSGAQCDITFDPSVITAVGVDDGGMFDLWFNGTLDINNTDGTIRNIVASNLGTTTSEKGTFAIIHFKTNDVSGTSPIGLLNVVVSDSLGSPLPIILGNGSIEVDSIPPALSYSLTGTAGSNNWYTSNVAVTLNATDENGIAEMKYRIDDGVWQDYTTPFTISTDGSHTVQFYAIDNAGNNNSTSFNVNIDREVPVLSHSLSGTAGNNNWYTSNVDVTLTATDASSGIDAIKYTINGGGAEQEYTAPFTISSNGQYTIDFYAIDNAGNTASEQSFSVKIDSTSPVSSVSISGTKEGNVYTTDVTVSISRTDSMSGIAYTKYRVNGGTWTTYTAPFTLSTDGTYTVDYYSADNAGNTESTKTATFEILKNNPPTEDFL